MSRRIVQVVAGLCNQYTAISVNPIIPMRRAGKGGCWFGPFLCNDRPMETEFLLANPVRRGGADADLP
jgi:hypothetical protein